MSVLITADLHFSDNPRDSYRFLIINRLLEMIEKYKVETLLILGDLTEKKDNHGAYLVNLIVNSLRELSDRCRVIILRGNHDGLDPAYPYFEFLRNFRKIDYIAHPVDFEVSGIGNCLFLPHTTDYKRDWRGLDLKDKGYKRIFAHNTFKGAQGQHRELDGLPLDLFQDTQGQVISGDVHVPHTIGPVTYVGSPYLVDFGDDFRPRALLIKPNSDPKSIAVPGPQKRLIEAHVSGRKEVKWPTDGLNAGDILKVRVTLTREQYVHWPEFVRDVKAWGKKNEYVIYAVQPVLEGGVRREGGTTVSRSKMSDVETLTAYGEQRGVARKTMTRGKKLMENSK